VRLIESGLCSDPDRCGLSTPARRQCRALSRVPGKVVSYRFRIYDYAVYQNLREVC
jgi:hypothetical protein